MNGETIFQIGISGVGVAMLIGGIRIMCQNRSAFSSIWLEWMDRALGAVLTLLGVGLIVYAWIPPGV